MLVYSRFWSIRFLIPVLLPLICILPFSYLSLYFFTFVLPLPPIGISLIYLWAVEQLCLWTSCWLKLFVYIRLGGRSFVLIYPTAVEMMYIVFIYVLVTDLLCLYTSWWQISCVYIRLGGKSLVFIYVLVADLLCLYTSWWQISCVYIRLSGKIVVSINVLVVDALI